LRIGFCGLGQMAALMAASVAEAGHDLTVWNRSPETAAATGAGLELRGAAAAGAGLELRGAAAARAAYEAVERAGLGDCDDPAVAAFLSGRARPS
jgi:3-hydroxyisobutyrate dehydrogenase-like beta-hydroxyacid dehydrogenase